MMPSTKFARVGDPTCNNEHEPEAHVWVVTFADPDKDISFIEAADEVDAEYFAGGEGIVNIEQSCGG
jgi:hypothetical protein